MGIVGLDGIVGAMTPCVSTKRATVVFMVATKRNHDV